MTKQNGKKLNRMIKVTGEGFNPTAGNFSIERQIGKKKKNAFHLSYAFY